MQAKEENTGAKPALRLSVLDVSPISAGETAAQALHHTVDLAKLTDDLGFTRYWLAEHHNSALIASSVPEIMIGQVAGATRRIRVGSGGVMLPNHAPLHVAESFRMLQALYPGRIDLGLGRAPGTDGRTALALRRTPTPIDDFPEQLTELTRYLSDDMPAENRYFGRVMAAPTTGEPMPPIYLLGSSDFSARLAAERGLGFAFAHHINPEPAIDALRYYRRHFRASEAFPQPSTLIAANVICAPTDAEADVLARSADLTLLGFQIGRFGPVPSIEEATNYPYTPEERAVVAHNRARLNVGSPATVGARLRALAEASGAEEIVVTTLTHDHAARRRSYELLAGEFGLGG